MNTPIYNKLLALEEEQRIPFHMPGHKRRGSGRFREISGMDITEITDYDNLHHPEGMIRESMDILKNIYGTRESWYLVNGSTVGILAAISACCRQGDGILISRSCHKSVYNAIRILCLKAYYFEPNLSGQYQLFEEIGDEQMERIRETLEKHPDIRAVVLPSPTYEGVVMDIARLKQTTKRYDTVLIVDEAHGAHFPFHTYFPESAVKCGADIVIQSTHKTLPAMTQTALLHLCSDTISPERITDMLSVYESSSPSYVLMASAEYSVAFMHENAAKVQEYVDNLQNFRKKCEQLRCIHLIGKEGLHCWDYDRGKLVFSVKNTDWNGIRLFDTLLQRYHVELEMADHFHCIAMTSVCDSAKMYEVLWEALREIDREIMKSMSDHKENLLKCEESGHENDLLKCEKSGHENDLLKCTETAGKELIFLPEKVLESWQCENLEKETVRLEEAAGRVAGAYVMLYPPGIPVLVPGEKIMKETVENLRYYIYNGYNVLGMSGSDISVLKKCGGGKCLL